MLTLQKLDGAGRIAGILALVLTVALSTLGCGGGSAESPAAVDATASIEGAVTGPTGSALAGASVTLTSGNRPATTTTSDSEGRYRFSKLEVQARWIVHVESTGMASLLRPVATRSGQKTTQDIALYAEGVRAEISATQAAAVTDATSGARLEVPANAWRRQDGGAISGALTVSITSVSPELAASRMPGDFTTVDTSGQVSQIESFGAVNITVSDSTGQRVNLANGVLAQVRIPAGSRGDLPATVGLYSLDETTGRWKDEGTATLAGSGSNRWYEASIPHLSSWNADRRLETVFVEGCVRDTGNQPLALRMVLAEGLDYSAQTAGLTDGQGKFRIPVKRGGQFRLVLQSPLFVGGSLSAAPVVAGPSDTDLQIASCLQERAALGLAPVIFQQPSDVAAFEGATVRFGVVIDGAEPLQYQWQKDGVDVLGAIGPVLVLRANIGDNGALFKVSVRNSLGSVTSREARLTVTAPPAVAPSISAQPTDRTVQAGGVAIFSVLATGSAPLRYQWFRNGQAITGETASELRFTAGISDTGALFTVTVSNSADSITSRAALLTVQDVTTGFPVITSEPSSVNANEGETARFSVTAQGDTPLSYQWLRDGVAIPGATAASYSLVAALTDNGSRFSVAVANGRGSVVSVGALLTVTQPKLTGTLTVSGDAVATTNGTFTPSDPESTFGLSGPTCGGGVCFSSVAMSGQQTEVTQLARYGKILTLAMFSEAASPGVAPGTQPTSVGISLGTFKIEGASFSSAIYSGTCPTTLPNCHSTVDLGVAVDPVQRTITFTNVTLFKDDDSGKSTTLNGVLRY
jgi:hypothetical protein